MAQAAGYTAPRSKERYLPIGRVRAFIERYCASHYQRHPDRPDDIGLEQFAFDSGVNPRAIWRIRRSSQERVSFTIVDTMLTNLDMQWLWHLSPEQGGFADFYGDEACA